MMRRALLLFALLASWPATAQNVSVGAITSLTAQQISNSSSTGQQLLTSNPPKSSNSATGQPFSVTVLKDSTYGTYDNAVAMSVIGNNTNPHAQVEGIGTLAGLAGYSSRDSVTLYASNQDAAPICTGTNATYTTTTATPATPFSAACIAAVNLALTNLFGVPYPILADTSDGFSGPITAIASDGTSITVTQWVSPGNAAAGQSPTNAGDTYIGLKSAVQTFNDVCIFNGGFFAPLVGCGEIDVINNSGTPNYPTNTDIVARSLANPQSHGIIVGTSGTTRSGVGLQVGGNFYYGMESHGSVKAAYAVSKFHGSGDTADPVVGFWAFNSTLAFAATHGGNGNSTNYDFYVDVSGSNNIGTTRIGDWAARNGLQISTQQAGQPVALQTGGIDATVHGIWSTKGAGVVELANTTAAVGSAAFRATPVASQVNFVQAGGAIATASPYVIANGSDSVVSLQIRGKGTGGSVKIQDNSAVVKIEASSSGIGFFATAPAAKPTASGSRGANAALASLLTGLASLGLITDSTTN